MLHFKSYFSLTIIISYGFIFAEIGQMWDVSEPFLKHSTGHQPRLTGTSDINEPHLTGTSGVNDSCLTRTLDNRVFGSITSQNLTLEYSVKICFKEQIRCQHLKWKQKSV